MVNLNQAAVCDLMFVFVTDYTGGFNIYVQVLQAILTMVAELRNDLQAGRQFSVEVVSVPLLNLDTTQLREKP